MHCHNSAAQLPDALFIVLAMSCSINYDSLCFLLHSLCTRMRQFSDLELSDLCYPSSTKARKQLGIKTSMGFSSGTIILSYFDEEGRLNSTKKAFTYLGSGAGRDCYSIGDVPLCLKVCEVKRGADGTSKYQSNESEAAISKDPRLDGLITKVLCLKEFPYYTVILVERAGATASQFLHAELNGVSSGSFEPAHCIYGLIVEAFMFKLLFQFNDCSLMFSVCLCILIHV